MDVMSMGFVVIAYDGAIIIYFNGFGSVKRSIETKAVR